MPRGIYPRRAHDECIGTTLGLLTVVSIIPGTRPRVGTMVSCRCCCGATVTRRLASIKHAVKNGLRPSCHRCHRGCFSTKENPASLIGPIGDRRKNPVYGSWLAMMHRCYTPHDRGYQRYGARGITVHERWHKFENFSAEMPPHPGPGYEIDRENNDGNYEPGNCRWVTNIDNANNRSTNRIFEWNGKKLSLTQIVRAENKPYGRVHCRLDRGWSLHDALYIPINRRR